MLTTSYLGAAVPGNTGRRTYVGDCLWSEPGCLLADRGSCRALFGGSMSPASARASCSDSGARFVLADCPTHGRHDQAARADHPLGARIWMRGGV